MKKLLLFTLSALITPAAQADITENLARAVVGAGVIGLGAHYLAKAKFSLKNLPPHCCVVEAMEAELEEYLVADLIKSGITEIPLFRVSGCYSGPVYKCIYVHCTTADAMLASLKAGEDLAEKFAAELVEIRCACWSTINLPELQAPDDIRKLGMLVWGAVVGATMPTRLTLPSVVKFAAASLIGMYACGGTIIWGMFRAYHQEIREADAFAIEHTNDPRQLEVMAIYLEEQEDAHGGGKYAERAQIYRKAAEKLKATQAA